MPNDTPNEIKLAMAGVEVCGALITFLVNERVIDQQKLSDWFNQVVDDRSPEEQNDPGSLILRRFSQTQKADQKTGRPSWLRDIIDGGRPPDDEE